MNCHTFVLVLVALAFASWTVACADEPRSGLTPAEVALCEQWMDAFCDLVVACTDDPTPPTHAECVDLMVAVLPGDMTCSHGYRMKSTEDMTTCVATYETWDCETFVPAAESADFPPSCVDQLVPVLD